MSDRVTGKNTSCSESGVPPILLLMEKWTFPSQGNVSFFVENLCWDRFNVILLYKKQSTFCCRCQYGWQLGFLKFKEKKSSICNKFSLLFSNPGKLLGISSGNFTQYASYNFNFALCQSEFGYLLFWFKVLINEISIHKGKRHWFETQRSHTEVRRYHFILFKS